MASTKKASKRTSKKVVSVLPKKEPKNRPARSKKKGDVERFFKAQLAANPEIISVPRERTKYLRRIAAEDNRIRERAEIAKRGYTIRELKKNQKQTIKAFLEDKLTADDLDKRLLAPGEYWFAEVPYLFTGTDLRDKASRGEAYTKQLYPTLRGLFQKLSQYAMHSKFIKNQLANIKIMKYGNPTKGMTQAERRAYIKRTNDSYEDQLIRARNEREERGKLVKKMNRQRRMETKRKLKQQEMTIKQLREELEKERNKNK